MGEITNTQKQVIANAGSDAKWSTSVCRYYFVDYINGVDTNVGYVDAAAGTIFTPATVRALAVKTIEQVQSMQPRQGAGRQMVTLIWGDKTLSAPIEYFRKDGTTRDWWDRSGYSGYTTNIVRASDFTNDADDRYRCAAYISSAGPNGDSSWTVNSFSAPVITNAAGTLPTFPTTEGACLHFATTSKCCAVKWRRSATTLEVTDGLAPVNGDTYLITRPSVKIASVIGIDDNSNTPQTATGSSFRLFGTTFVGLELAGFSPTFTLSAFFRGELSKVTFCKVAITGFTTIRMMAVNGFQMNGLYINEVGLAIQPGLSFHFKAPAAAANAALQILGAAGAQVLSSVVPSLGRIVASADAGQNVLVSVAGIASAASAPYLMASAVHGIVQLSNILAMGNANTPNGLGGNTVASRLVVHPQVAGTGLAVLGGVQFLGGVKASLAFTIIGNVLAGSALAFNGVGNHINPSDVVQDTDANTNYGCTLVGTVFSGSLNTSDNTLTLGTGVTVTGTLGDVLFEAGVVKTWASITQGLVSVLNNRITVQNQTVGAFRKVTIDTFANSTPVTSDPASVVDGDVWLANISSVGSLSARIGGVVLRAPLMPAISPTPAAYTNANITVDAYGRVTAAASGTSGLGASGQKFITPVLIAAHDSNASASVKSAGVAFLDPTDFTMTGTTKIIVFRVVAAVGNSTVTGHVKLRDMTNGVDIHTFNLNGAGHTTATKFEATLTTGTPGTDVIANSDVQYEVRIYVDTPSAVSDFLELWKAEFRIINTIP